MITNRLCVWPPPKHPNAVNGHEQGWVHKNGDGLNTWTREDWAAGGFNMRTDACWASGMFFYFYFYSTNDYLHIAHTEHHHHQPQGPSTTTLQWQPLSHPSHPLLRAQGLKCFLGPAFLFFHHHQSTTMSTGPETCLGPLFFLFYHHHNREYRPEMCLGFLFSFLN